MRAVALSAQDAASQLAAEHGLSESIGLSRELLACIMRGQLARMYPCSEASLLTASRNALQALAADIDELTGAVADVLEDLLTCGDVVELARVTIAQADEHSQWLVPAPPSFVVRDKRAYLLGIASDNAPFLPEEHWRRIQHNGAARTIDLGDDGAVSAQALGAFGLRQLDETEWLEYRPKGSAAQFVDQLRERLRNKGVDGPLPGMKVLAHQGVDRRPYQRRWLDSCTASGLHIARLEQPYGSPLWYLADLSSGRCRRSLLLPYHLDKERACDQAWRAQLAIDASQGHPGRYAVQTGQRPTDQGNADQGKTVLRLDFPLPLSARRRLRFLGGPSARSDSPYTFTIPSSEEQAECRHLEEQLWLQRATA